MIMDCLRVFDLLDELTKDLAWNSFYLLQLGSSLIGGKEKSEHPDFVCMSGHP